MIEPSTTGFYVAGGTLRPDTPSYVERGADQELLDRAMAGDFCYVLTSRQMGKSSLMARVARRLKEAGVHTAIIDLTGIGAGEGDENEKASADRWYKGVARAIARGLNLKADLNDWWREREDLPALQRLTEFFGDVALAEAAGRIVIFVDEIDTTIKLPFADDFFAAIRACYNKRAAEPEFNRLSFVLLGVASPSELIKDTARTPFNIGHRIDLTDFTFEEAKPLARGLRVTEERGEQALRRILHWTGGHPYLTQKLCQTLAQEQPPRRQDRQEKKEDDDEKAPDPISFDSSWRASRLGGDAYTEFIDSIVDAELLSPQAGLNDSNLNFVRDRVTKGGRLTPAMLKLYRRIRRGDKVIDDTRSPVHSWLKLSGLIVRREDRSLRVRNLVYERVFTGEWAKKAMPVDRRQRIAALSASATLLIGFGVLITLFLPSEYVRVINNAADDVPMDAYNRLHSLPGFGGKADELMAQFWGRRALREEGEGDRDEALLSRLQAVSTKSTDLRRSEANRLIGPDYNDLLMTYRHSQRVNAVAFTPDGKFVLTGSNDGTARLWRVDSGQLIFTLRHDSDVYAVAFSPDGKLVLTGGRDRTARLWRVDSGQLISTLHHDDDVLAVAFSPDGKFVLTGSYGGMARLWRIDSGQLIFTLRHDSFVPAVTFSPDGKFILTGSDDGAARLWRVDSGQLISALRHNSSVLAVAFSPDGKLVLTGGDDYTARLWRVDSRQLISTLRHDYGVRAVAFSSDGKFVLTGSSDSTARVWRVDSGQLIFTFRHTNWVRAVAFSPDGKLILTGGDDGAARLWRVDSDQLTSVLRHDNLVQAVAFSPDGKFVLTGGDDYTARVWRVDSGQLIFTFRHDNWVRAVAFSPDGKYVLTGSDDNTARLWRSDSGQLISTLRHDDWVRSVAFSPDGKYVLTGSNDGRMRLWRVDSGQLISTFREDSSVRAVAFSADGKYVLTGSYDGRARLWRVDSGQLTSTLSDDANIRAVAFSPGGKYVLTGSNNGAARMWRADIGQLISTLRHDDIVLAVAFSPDGKNAMAMTSNWIHLSSVTEGGLIHRASRLVPGPWRANGFHFDSTDGSRLRIAWLPTGESIKIETLKFDAPGAPPIEGDPKELLNDWMKRLALKFDERWKIVPSQPVETVKNER
jgi:WD40 repeat protein